MVREIIHISCGDEGLTLGCKIWEQYGIEHGINNGKNMSKQDDDKNIGSGPVGDYQCIFNSTKSERYVARAVFVGSDDNLTIGKNDIFDEQYCINYNADLSGNTMEYSPIASSIIDEIGNKVRLQVELCGNVEAFILNRSINKTYGSVIGRSVLEAIADTYHAKKSVVSNNLMPKDGDNIVPLYVLSNVSDEIDHSQLSFVYFNDCDTGVSQIARQITTINKSRRFPDTYLPCDYSEYEQNLVPFPKLHFFDSFTASFANDTPKHKPSKYEWAKLFTNCVNYNNFYIKFSNKYAYNSFCFLLFFAIFVLFCKKCAFLIEIEISMVNG